MDLSALIVTYGPLIEAELREGKNPADLLRQYGPDLAKAIASEREQRDLHRQAVFVADLASRFLQSSVETLETADELKGAAERAVQLAGFVLAESLRVTGARAQR